MASGHLASQQFSLRSRNSPFHTTPAEPASCHPASEHLFSDGPVAQGTTGKVAAQSTQKLGSTEGKLAYAAVVAGPTGPQQPHGPHKPRVQITLNLLPHLR